MSKHSTLQRVRAVLSEDCACDPDTFLRNDVTIVDWQERPGRRRFPVRARPLSIVTMGNGVVMSAHPDHSAWLREEIPNLDRDSVFASSTVSMVAQYLDREGARVAGPDIKYVCTRETLRPAAVPKEFQITRVAQQEIADLYRFPGFRNALSYDAASLRPDVAATVAYRDGVIVGIAGASADSEDMWQIGIDVIESARGRGVGKALVSRLTGMVLAEGKIPYYATAVANVRSSGLAISLGYWPAWAEMYARDR